MKICGAAVLAVSCMPYSAAFIVPNVIQKPITKLNLLVPDAPVEIVNGKTT